MKKRAELIHYNSSLKKFDETVDRVNANLHYDRVDVATVHSNLAIAHAFMTIAEAIVELASSSNKNKAKRSKKT